MKTRTKLILSGLILVIIGAAASGTVYSAFSTTTANSGNTLGAGTVVLADNDDNSALFTLSNMKPGDTSTKCLKVDYTGTLSSTVKMYGATGGTGLGAYVTLQIRRGSFPGAPPASNACTGFSSAATVYSGNLSAYPTTWGSGINEGTWANGTSNVYEITMTLQDDNAAQGLTATQTFTWEAQNA